MHARVRDRATLVVVPDDSLHGVPFAALYDARRRRYLIEDHTVIVSPAFTHFARHAAAPADWRAARDLRAIVVTNPTTTGLISAQLPPLPGADAEAAHLATLFGDVRILRDTEATKSRLRAALPGGQILHVASHARVNYRAPWRSYFVLAPDGGRPGEELLFMSDLSSLPLARSAVGGARGVRQCRWSDRAGRRVAEPGAAVPDGGRPERDRESVARQRSRLAGVVH